MRDRIIDIHGEYYTSQKSIGLYPTSGTASDWCVIGTCDHKQFPNCLIYRFYSYDANFNNGDYRAAGFTIELRDTGQYGFLLPPDQVH